MLLNDLERESMHVFLTGALQVGKSTIVRQVSAATQLALGGFITFFGPDRQVDGRKLYLYGVCDAVDYAADHVVARFENGKPVPDPACFDRLGTSLLARAHETAGLIIMDECGRLEHGALCFQRAVLSALDGEIPVLGVVRHDAGGWTNQIREHPGVQVVTVTQENRDALLKALTAHYKTNRTGEFAWLQS